MAITNKDIDVTVKLKDGFSSLWNSMVSLVQSGSGKMASSNNKATSAIHLGWTSVLKAMGVVGAGFLVAEVAILAVKKAVELLVAVFNKLVEVVSTTLRKFTEFELKLAQVSTLIDTSVESVDKISNSLLRLSTSLAQTPRELVDALYKIRSATFTAAEQMDILTESSKLGYAGVSSLDGATRLLNATLNAFGKENLTASEAADSLFTAIRRGVLTAEDLSTGFGTIASQSVNLGISLDETLAAVSAMTLTGLQASTSMRYLRTALSKIVSPSEQAQKAAQGLSFEFNQAGLQALGLQGFLFKLSEEVGDDAERMTKLFGSVRSVNAVLALTGSAADSYAETLRQFSENAGDLEEAYEKVANTVGFKTLQITSGLEAVQVAFGKVFAAILDGSGVFDAIIKALELTIDVLIEFYKTSSGISDISRALANLGRAFGLSALSAGQWGTVLLNVLERASKAVASIISVVTIVIETIKLPFQLVVGAIQVLAVEVSKAFIHIQETAKTAFYGVARVASFFGRDETYARAIKATQTLNSQIDNTRKLMESIESRGGLDAVVENYTERIGSAISVLRSASSLGLDVDREIPESLEDLLNELNNMLEDFENETTTGGGGQYVKDALLARLGIPDAKDLAELRALYENFLTSDILGDDFRSMRNAFNEISVDVLEAYNVLKKFGVDVPEWLNEAAESALELERRMAIGASMREAGEAAEEAAKKADEARTEGMRKWFLEFQENLKKLDEQEAAFGIKIGERISDAVQTGMADGIYALISGEGSFKDALVSFMRSIQRIWADSVAQGIAEGLKVAEAGKQVGSFAADLIKTGVTAVIGSFTGTGVAADASSTAAGVSSAQSFSASSIPLANVTVLQTVTDGNMIVLKAINDNPNIVTATVARSASNYGSPLNSMARAG